MLIFIFKPLKWFTEQNGVIKALILSIIGLLGYGTFFCLDYFWQIRPESLFGKLVREGFCFLLAGAAIYIFVMAVISAVKERRECFESAWYFGRWYNGYWYQHLCLLTGLFGLLGFGALAKVLWTVLTKWEIINCPLTDLWYALIPGAIFIAIGLITLILKILWKIVKGCVEYISDQWHRA